MDKLSVAREALGKVARARGHLANIRAHGNAEANACLVIERALDALAALAQPAPDDAIERIAETIWRAELRRATGKGRNVPWTEINDTDRERYRFIARDVAALTPAPQSAETGEEAARARMVIRFLKGEGPLEGVWFGDRPVGERGNFWWRKYLPDIAAAIRGGAE